MPNVTGVKLGPYKNRAYYDAKIRRATDAEIIKAVHMLSRLGYTLTRTAQELGFKHHETLKNALAARGIRTQPVTVLIASDPVTGSIIARANNGDTEDIFDVNYCQPQPKDAEILRDLATEPGEDAPKPPAPSAPTAKKPERTPRPPKNTPNTEPGRRGRRPSKNAAEIARDEHAETRKTQLCAQQTRELNTLTEEEKEEYARYLRLKDRMTRRGIGSFTSGMLETLSSLGQKFG